MILFTLNDIELEFNTESSILTVRWIGPLKQDDFAIIWQQVLILATKHQIRFILLDTTFVHTQNSPDIDDYSIHQYFRQTLALPYLEKIARIVTNNTTYDQKITNLYTTLLQQNKGIQFQNFNHYYEAMDWLLEMHYVENKQL
ncbi:hypothetical protein [Adhaeribacter radiodurans]|uniref:STAS/SEC14 domain-containing protein n=1 Tax=Adhaeribacter radiodurans TaxID=2745197 RepID=A0A7L7L5U9_9BACT|nr:hypothetical protein [Adhaeribacter radiodurans]QMU28196.1 hypothetical protein HUW48_09155 [Adhaeribacter radiodurans]